MIPFAFAVPYFDLKIERLQICRLRCLHPCLAARCCEMDRCPIVFFDESRKMMQTVSGWKIVSMGPWASDTESCI